MLLAKPTMIVKWPEHMFARLLPTGLQGGGNHRYAEARQSPPYSEGDEAPSADHNNKHDEALTTKSSHEAPLELSPTVSFSEDEGNNDDALSTISEKSGVSVRRVRFDETVQITTIPKVTKAYPKTPPRRRKERTTDCESSTEDSTDSFSSSTESQSSSKKKVITSSMTLTPRRLSLRSASMSRLANKAKDESKEVETAEPDIASPKEEPVVETTTSKGTPRRTPRKRTSTIATPRRASLRSAQKPAKTEVAEVLDSDSSNKTHESSPPTPSRTTRRQSLGSPPPSKTATKAENLKALTLLGKLPKQTKRELFAPLQRIKDCHGHDELPENLMMLVVDYKSAGELLHLLSEKPALVDTVLSQLRSYEG